MRLWLVFRYLPNNFLIITTNLLNSKNLADFF